MTGQSAPEEKTQSGTSVALGIIGFIVGLVALLLLIKYFIG